MPQPDTHSGAHATRNMQSCVSRELRPIFGGGVINDFHVVYALNMLANDVMFVHVCTVDLDKVATLCS